MAEKHHVLSVLVKDGPACAAELDRRLHEVVGLLGSTSEMVERGLLELCSEGFVEGTGELCDVADEPGRRRVVYAATVEGEREVDRWMLEPIPMPSGFVEEMRKDCDWVLSVKGPEDLEAFIEQAREREGRARADLGDERCVSMEEIDAGARPWREVARDLVRNAEVLRLECEIDLMVAMQALAREELEELRGPTMG